MGDLILNIRQSPAHTVSVGDVLVFDGVKLTVTDIKPRTEHGMFVDWGQELRSIEVEVTVERERE